MESKLLVGGKNIIDHTNEQQKMLEVKRQEIAEQVNLYVTVYVYRFVRHRIQISYITVNCILLLNTLFKKKSNGWLNCEQRTAARNIENTEVLGQFSTNNRTLELKFNLQNTINEKQKDHKQHREMPFN